MLWTCTRLQKDGQNCKNTGVRQAFFLKCPSRRANPSLGGRLGNTATPKWHICLLINGWGGHLVSNGQVGKAKKESSRKEEKGEHDQFLDSQKLNIFYQDTNIKLVPGKTCSILKLQTYHEKDPKNISRRISSSAAHAPCTRRGMVRGGFYLRWCLLEISIIRGNLCLWGGVRGLFQITIDTVQLAINVMKHTGRALT